MEGARDEAEEAIPMAAIAVSQNAQTPHRSGQIRTGQRDPHCQQRLVETALFNSYWKGLLDTSCTTSRWSRSTDMTTRTPAQTEPPRFIRDEAANQRAGDPAPPAGRPQK